MPPSSGVNILVRVRPMLARELAFDNAVELLSEQEILVYKPDQEFASTCDRVLGPQSTQDDVYQHVRESVVAALSGFNNTIMTYGQTGTGKTHTMMGEHGIDVLDSDPETQRRSFGIIPRAVQDLFTHANLVQSRQGCVVNVVASYLEIYNDRLYDLLQPFKREAGRDPLDMNRRKAMLEVREDPQGSTYVPDLLTVKVKSPRNVLQLISRGNRNRALRHTEMNIHSSRSHAILQLSIEQWPEGGQSGRVVRSKLNFVDLAGSERWNHKADMGAERVSEMTAINGSLSALATVVAALSEGRPHVPYRSSKLTHLLQDSLGGNCRTTIISTVSPSIDAFDETVSTLKFADRAAAIDNNPVVNVSRDMSSVLAIKEKEIHRLRGMLSQLTAAAEAAAAAGGEQGMDAAVVEAAMAEFGRGDLGVGEESDDPIVMREQLRVMRRALQSERAIRAGLEARLHSAGLPVSAPAASPGPGGSLDLCASPSTSARYEYLRVVTPPASSGAAPGAASSGLRQGSSTHGGLLYAGDDSSAQSEDSAMASMIARRTLAWGDVPLDAAASVSSSRRHGSRQSQQRRSASNSRSTAFTSPTRRPPPPSGASAKANSLDEAIQAIRQRIAELSSMGKSGKVSQGTLGGKARSASNSRQQQRRSGSAAKRQVGGANGGVGDGEPAGSPVMAGMGVRAGMALSRAYQERQHPHLGGQDREQREQAPSVDDEPAAGPSGGAAKQQQLQHLRKSLSTGDEQSSAAAAATDAALASGVDEGDEGLPPPLMSTAPAPIRWGRSALLSKFTDEPTQMPGSPTASAASRLGREASLDSPSHAAAFSPSASTAGAGWGRAALFAAAAAATPPTPSTATSGTAPGATGGGSWGRAALLASTADLPQTPSCEPDDSSQPLTSPSAAHQRPPPLRSFGRSGLGLAPTGRSSILDSPSLSSGALLMQPRGSSGLGTPSAPGATRSSSVPRLARNSSDSSSNSYGRHSLVSSKGQPRREASPARLDKGSLVYIFGTTTNSLKAKALANALA